MGGLHLKMAINNLLLLSSIFATVPALPPAQPTTTTEASVKSRTNGLINDVKEINLFLNIPKGCDIVYDGLIKQLEGCRSGSNHGDPRLTSGCLLKLSLLSLSTDLRLLAQAGLHPPAAGLRQYRPLLPSCKGGPPPPVVPCNGTYCPTSGKLIFSGDAGTNVAFPQEQVVQAPRDQVSIGDLLGDKPVYGSVFDEQRDGPRFG